MEQTVPIEEVDVSPVSTTRCIAAFEVYDDGSRYPIAILTWDRATGTVQMVYVDPDYRGGGLSTRMLDTARAADGGPLNAHGGEFTEAGEAWARAHGMEPTVDHRLTDNEMRAMAARLLVWIGRNAS